MYRYDQLHPVSESTSSPLHMFTKICAMANTFTPLSSPDMTNSHYLISPSADANQSNIDHITCLERSLCSNFHCCGAQLADLHALIDHFEEDHIMVLAPNGKRVYPREGLRTVPLHSIQTSFTNTTPASSRASSVSPSSSSSSAPSTPSDFCSPTTGPFASRKSSLTTASVPPVYTPFTPSLPVDPADPYPDADEITALHNAPALYEFPTGVDAYPSMLLSPLPPAVAELMSPFSSSDEDEDMEVEMTDCSGTEMSANPNPLTAYVCVQKEQEQALSQEGQAPQPTRTTPKKNVKFAVSSPRGRPSIKLSEAHKGASPPTSKSKSKNRQSSSGPSASARRREKLFRCSTPRCTKSYLNPNGLKYHLEKGTCNIEGENEFNSGSGDVNMESNALSQSQSQSQGTPLQVVPTPTSNFFKHDSTDAELRIPSTPELDPKYSFVLPYPTNSVHTPYYRHRPSADPVATSSVSSPDAPAPASETTTSSRRGETPRQLPQLQPQPQQQHPHSPPQQVAYHYPVPSYPQLGGPSALLAGYTTLMHRLPYFSLHDPTSFGSPRAGAEDADGSHSSQSQVRALAYALSPPPPSALSTSSSASPNTVL